MNKVVIVGRMNVGKSTLFNRLSTHVKSMTFDYEGVTRDILRDDVSWRGYTFELIDTGGITIEKPDAPLVQEVRDRALQQINDADVVLFVVDGIAGVTAADQELSALLRKRSRRTFLVINKADAKVTQENIPEFYQLYHERMFPISALHGTGINDLLDAVVELFPAVPESVGTEETPAYRVVLLGRPNVGKSSLLNQLVKEERALVSEIPGTTREPLSERISFYKEMLQLTDTPGIRRQRAVEKGLESLMVKSSFRALKDADIVLLLVDASEARLVDQELKLAFYAFADMHKALILLVNKTDLLDGEKQKELDASFERYPHLMKKIEKLSISCKTGKNVGRVLPLVKKVWERMTQQFPPEELTRVIIGSLRSVPLVKSEQRLQVFTVEQVGVAPITIKMRVNYPRFFETSELNFFENVLRRHYSLVSAPIRFIIV
ncbi:MAG: ribosome biogenesis GTPase Der [Candidatus Babeliaceae bacterium]|nr:ribosome biogenesis GTPase Der [Candidatus Babeliaceae bacterium]